MFLVVHVDCRKYDVHENEEIDNEKKNEEYGVPSVDIINWHHYIRKIRSCN